MEKRNGASIKKKSGLRLTKLTKGILIASGIAVICLLLNYLEPGLRVSESKTLSAMEQNKDNIDNVMNTKQMALPSPNVSTSLNRNESVTIGAYAWNAQRGIISANGGPKTTKGSLMESLGVNLTIDKQDWFNKLVEGQIKFVTELHKGNEYPSSDKAYMGVMIMGDGGPFYLSTVNKALKDKFGDKYHVEIVSAFGMSNGEDKLIGPKEWVDNPSSMVGKVISVVPGDGDWVTLMNYCFANKIPVNPTFGTYDAKAVNIFPSKDDDYINSAKELIGSQLQGVTYEFKEVENGKLTGDIVKKKIDGCATWTPGDTMVFDKLSGFTDVASTKDFPNQMATTFIVVKEWASKHPETISNIIKGALTAGNQIKQFPEWNERASQAVYETFKYESPEYWTRMFKGETKTKNGLTYSVGGSRVLNYADVMQYYGITDGKNRYKSVYNQVSNYLTEFNPFGFIDSVGEITPYEDAVNLYYLKNINDIDSGSVTEIDYSQTKTETLANGQWHINFATGSDVIQKTSFDEMETIYNLLVQAEQTKVNIIGHTDNTGSSTINNRLSNERANSVANYLAARGIKNSRFQVVTGKGSKEPIATNNTSSGRKENRRVQVVFLK